MEEKIKNKFLPSEGVELPEELKPVMKKAKKYEIITIIYLISVVVVMYLTLSSSQAMKAAWLEDLISIVPSVAFVVALKFYDRKAHTSFPYGYHRAFGIGFAFGSFALLLMGIFVLVDSSMALIKMEHPTIPHKQMFGYNIWFGWVMILALLYSFIPALIIGRKKLPLADKLHNKLLYVDADAQKADWMTAGAAIIGIIGVGFGLWWADAVAALFISISILRDGIARGYDAITDFLGQIPTKINKQEFHRLNKSVIDALEKEEWISDFRIRMREEGEIFLGEAFVIPASGENLIENINKCAKKLQEIDWKIYQIVIQPVKNFKVKDSPT